MDKPFRFFLLTMMATTGITAVCGVIILLAIIFGLV